MFKSNNKFIEFFRKMFALTAVVVLTIKFSIKYLGTYEFSSSMLGSIFVASLLTVVFWFREKRK